MQMSTSQTGHKLVVVTLLRFQQPPTPSSSSSSDSSSQSPRFHLLLGPLQGGQINNKETITIAVLSVNTRVEYRETVLHADIVFYLTAFTVRKLSSQSSPPKTGHKYQSKQRNGFLGFSLCVNLAKMTFGINVSCLNCSENCFYFTFLSLQMDHHISFGQIGWIYQQSIAVYMEPQYWQNAVKSKTSISGYINK